MITTQLIRTVLTLFVLHVQNEEKWICQRPLGELPVPMTHDEVLKLVADFAGKYEVAP